MPGPYSVHEINFPTGWTLLSVTCAGCNADGQGTISLQAGQTVHCFFNNQGPTPPSGCQVNCGGTGTTLQPGLTLTKGVSLNQAGPFAESLTTTAGTTVWYQVVVTNPGDGGIGGLSITDTLGWPASCLAIPSPFAAKATYTCTYSRSALEGTTVNTATATGAGLTASDSATVTVTGGVQAVTATPKPVTKPTLPPTDSLGGLATTAPGMNPTSVLLALSGLALVLWILAPVPARVRRRDRRG